jgi:hypothetical protein
MKIRIFKNELYLTFLGLKDENKNFFLKKKAIVV